MSLRARLATPDAKRRFVRSLFATIADRYDLITRLLSYGQDSRWKNRLVARAGVVRGVPALDLATGTGDIALLLQARGARTVGLDVTPRMIELARRRSANGQAFLVGDMVALPFADAAFDLVTTGYGLRNVPDLGAAIDEIHRVLRVGGRALSLDFNRPRNLLVRSVYLVYLEIVGGLLGFVLHGDSTTYRYIPASIRRYPGADAVAGMMKARGFRRVEYVPVLFGLMAIHDAQK